MEPLAILSLALLLLAASRAYKSIVSGAIRGYIKSKRSTFMQLQKKQQGTF